MKTNDSVQIEKAANGWIVRPASNYARDNICMWTDCYVFQTFKAMADWLDKHFSSVAR